MANAILNFHFDFPDTSLTRQTYTPTSFWVPHSALQEDTSPWHPTIWMSLPTLREVQCVMQYFQFVQWYFTFLFVCYTVLLHYFHKHIVQPIQCVLLCGDRHSVRRSLIISLVSTNNQWLMAALIYRTIPNINKQWQTLPRIRKQYYACQNCKPNTTTHHPK